MPYRIIVLVCLLFGNSQAALAAGYPEPNPPALLAPWTAPPAISPRTTGQTPTREWTYHKTADSAHPNGDEQQMMWLMNRARSNPTQEGIRLAASTDPAVISAMLQFGVDKTVLKSEFAGYAAKPPAAFDRRLYAAALAHANDLIARNAQDHTNQLARVNSTGFQYTSYRLCAYSYALSAQYAHAGYNIDWGPGDSTGMQPGRGHRMALMSVDGNYTNVGTAAVYDNNSSNSVGPMVTVGNFFYAKTSSTEYNAFIVGTVWKDLNGNGQYDPGEGLAGIMVLPDMGTYYAVTSAGGGFAIPITATGTCRLTFTGTNLSSKMVQTLTVSNQSVLADLAVSAGSLYTITADGGSGGSILPAGTTAVNPGSSLNFTFIPNSGYVVSDVLIDGVSVGALSGYPFSGVAADHAISVRFAPSTSSPDVTADTPQVTAGKAVNFTAAQPANGTVATAAWNFGDGTTLTVSGQTQVSHTYTDVGSYTVSCDLTYSQSSITTRQSMTTTVSAGAVEIAPDQDDGVMVTKATEQDTVMTALDLRSAYSITDSTIEPLRSVADFTATLQTDSTATFRFAIYDMPGEIARLRLYKLKTNGTNELFNYASSATQDEGVWWIEDKDGNELPGTAILAAGATYRVHFRVKDNGRLDQNPADGALRDPVILASSASSTTGSDVSSDAGSDSGPVSSSAVASGSGGGGGGGGGCVFLPQALPSIDILLALLASAFLFIKRK